MIERESCKDYDRLQCLHQVEMLYKDLPPGYNEDGVHMGRAFTYGELTKEGLDKLICEAQCLIDDIECFVDLGSGTGKLVMSSLLLLPGLKRSIGVELSAKRHATAIQAKEKMQRLGLDRTLLERAVFLNEDVQLAVAAVANADVLWVSNQCFPPELNCSIAKLIDAFAPAGSIVCSTVLLQCQRVATGMWRDVELPASWSATHNANIGQITEGLPYALCPELRMPWGEDFLGSDSMTFAFLFWIRAMNVTGDGKPSREEEDVLPTRFLRSAICTAFLHAELLLPEDLIEDIAAGTSMENVLTDAEMEYGEDGLDLDEFKSVCWNASWATSGFGAFSMLLSSPLRMLC